MEVTRLVLGPLKTNCYLVSDGESGEALAIDPVEDGAGIATAASDRGLRIVAIACTHSHFDHTGGVAELRDLTGVPFYIGREALPSLRAEAERARRRHGRDFTPAPDPDRLLDEGDHLAAGGLRFDVLDTPGHWQGDISLYEPTAGVLFTGDALFRREIGRFNPGCDVPLLLDSIRTRLLVLPDDTLVYPGHGPRTTVGFERRHNRGLLLDHQG